MSGYMLLTGQPITAEEAYNAGLVSRLVEEDKVDDEVKNICAAIASKPRGVITLGKRFYQQQVKYCHSSTQPQLRVGSDKVIVWTDPPI